MGLTQTIQKQLTGRPLKGTICLNRQVLFLSGFLLFNQKMYSCYLIRVNNPNSGEGEGVISKIEGVMGLFKKIYTLCLNSNKIFRSI